MRKAFGARRLWALGLALVVAAALLPACTTQEAEGKVLVVGTTDSVTTLDPADAYDYLSSRPWPRTGR